jgi:hypothetical protein
VILDPTPELLREQMVTAMRGFPITELLPEQQRYLDLYREEYFRIGSCTKPANRPRAEAAITALYSAYEQVRPRFEWGTSPLWGAKRTASLEHSIWDLIWDLFVDSIWWTIMDSFAHPFIVSLGDSLVERIWVELDRSIRASIRTSISASSGEVFVRLVDDAIGNSIAGSHESSCLLQYFCAADLIGVTFREEDLVQLRLHEEVARSCGWWWPYEGLCVCTDRPEILEWDDDSPPKLKHVRYRDGFEWKKG